MNYYLPFPAIVIICFIFLGAVTAGAAVDLEKIKKEQTAMSAVIAQFSKDRNICSDGKSQPHARKSTRLKWNKTLLNHYMFTVMTVNPRNLSQQPQGHPNRQKIVQI